MLPQKSTKQAINDPATLIRQQLKADLVVAMRARQRVAVATLRATLSAIDQAEAVEVDPHFVPVSGITRDVARKLLTEADIAAILQREMDDLTAAIADYQRLTNEKKIAELQEAQEVLHKYLVREEE
ncbi:MAG: hypothetical protein H6668_16515 [Ardenticatenaceae bacterium]|nr:hypothetical protein [Ardenticatenaceae bacterium]